jgi:hypothetical protein
MVLEKLLSKCTKQNLSRERNLFVNIWRHQNENKNTSMMFEEPNLHQKLAHTQQFSCSHGNNERCYRQFSFRTCCLLVLTLLMVHSAFFVLFFCKSRRKNRAGSTLHNDRTGSEDNFRGHVFRTR